MEGGALAIVEDGDKIMIDIPKRRITLKVSEEDIEKRLLKWHPPKAKISEGYIARYARMVSSGGQGAVVE